MGREYRASHHTALAVEGRVTSLEDQWCPVHRGNDHPDLTNRWAGFSSSTRTPWWHCGVLSRALRGRPTSAIHQAQGRAVARAVPVFASRETESTDLRE